jgi:hypothetical protein
MMGNPLVTGAPNIRFFASAPIICADGSVVGAFSIFDDKPRIEFSVNSKRKLIDFTKIISTDIELLMEEYDAARQHDKLAMGIKPLQKPSEPTISEDRDLEETEMARRSRRLTGKLLRNIEEEAENKDRHSRLMISESPVEDEEPVVEEEDEDFEDEIQTDLVPAGLAARRASPLRLVPSPRNSYHSGHRLSRTSVILHDQPTPPQTPSRPFSIASSLDTTVKPTGQPPNTPRPVSDASDTLDKPSGGIVRKRRPSALLEPGIIQEQADDRKDHLPRSPGPVTSFAEASFATSLIARNLGYDLVYLLRIRPNRTHYTESQLKQAGHLGTRVLVSYNMPDPEPVFDPSLHLRALRSDGGLIYHNPNQPESDQDDVGYSLGVLLPLLRDGVNEPRPESGISEDDYQMSPEATAALTHARVNCRGGVVLAAFKKCPGPDAGFGAQEVMLLREYGSAMRDIFINADGGRVPLI